MNINFLTGVGGLSPIKKAANRTVIRDNGLQQDTFVRTTPPKSAAPKKQSDFNVQAAVDELKDIKAFNGKAKFKDDKLDELKTVLSENPEKWNAIKTISNQPKMISSLVLEEIRQHSMPLRICRFCKTLKASRSFLLWKSEILLIN